jgi:hypothetical protein
MAIRITENEMTSDQTPHRARRDASDRLRWCVSWLPQGRTCDRNQAISAMVLAVTVEQIVRDGGHHLDHRLWQFVCNWAGELGMGGLDALGMLQTADASR